MKNAIDRMSVVLGTVVALAAIVVSSRASGAPTAVSWEWRFDTSASPAAPEVRSGGAGSASAAITRGDFASGWLANSSVLGTAQGIWDMGRNGTISITNSAGLAGDSAQVRLLTISVAQYQDGGIYDQLAVVCVPGATLCSSTASYAAAANLGGWLTHVSQWSVPAGAAANSILIVGAYNGSLVDRVVVESTLAVVVQPPPLSIRSVGPANSQVQLSWAANGSTDWVLESTTDVSNPQGWAPVGAPVQVAAGTASVTLDAAGSARFYRLKQP